MPGKIVLLIAVVIGCMVSSPARAFETNVRTRDPSTIIKRNGVYWVYGTGQGIRQFSSTDRIHWTFQGPVYPQAPEWEAAAVPANRNNGVWAPDIHFFNGKYHLYYCYSTMGSNTSAIGTASSANLDPRSWVDEGMVIHTDRTVSYNALDPCIFEDAVGGMWLSFGSYFSGIKLIRIDPTTGKQSAADPTVYDLAGRAPGAGWSIEASCVSFHDGYYYLFVDWAGCCAGSKSTYNIRVGRSRIVTGPYLDKTGKNMNDGGGTLFLGSVPDKGAGAPFDDEVGPGHAGILHDTDGDWFSCHYEWTRDQHGATTLNLFRLAWDTDGWPRVVLDPGPYQLVSDLELHDVAGVAGDARKDGSLLETGPYHGGEGQEWTLGYVGDGYYNILEAGTTKALSAAGCAANNGARIEIASYRKRDCQLWYLQQNDDGTYTLLTRNSNKALALDVTGSSPFDGVPLEQWTANGQDAQKWSFRVR